MANQKKLILKQLDKKLGQFKEVEDICVPESGWINAIRTALNMTLEQLGKKLNITKQSVKKIETKEASGSISIKTLKEIGKVFDLHFVYGFVPINGTLENSVEIKARKLATKIVMRTNQNMKLENQGNSEKRLKQSIDELTIEIKNEMRRSLWDSN